MKHLYILSAFCLTFFTSCRINANTGEVEATWLFWVILAIFGVFVVYGVISSQKRKAHNDSQGKKFNKLAYEYDVEAKVIGLNNSYMFLVDNGKRQIVYMDTPDHAVKIPFANVIGVYLNIDDNVITKQSLGKAIGRAAVGSMIAGRTGILLGAMSVESYQVKKVKKVEVVIQLRNFRDTSLHIDCFDAWRDTDHAAEQVNPAKKSIREMYEKGCDDAKRITELIGVIIDYNSNAELYDDDDDNSEMSLAERIQKLGELRDEGLITDEEFDSLKKQIISSQLGSN